MIDLGIFTVPLIGALSVFLVNELYDNVDVGSGLEQRLPADLKPLARSLAAHDSRQ